MPAACRRPVKAKLVNWLPWSVLKISGLPCLSILRIALARQNLLNPFERRRGPRDGALAMWKVRRWRAQEGTIGGMPVVEPAVPAGPPWPSPWQCCAASRGRTTTHGVIAGRKAGSHLTDFQHSWRRIRTRPGLDHVRIYDLRHSSRVTVSWSAKARP